MYIQKTKWGYIQWVHRPVEGEDLSRMSAGFTHIKSGVHQERHIHYGHEQFVYVVQGQGFYYVNNQKQHFCAGDYFYFDQNILHETINTGDCEIIELIVSVPILYTQRLPAFPPSTQPFEGNIYNAADVISLQLDSWVNIPVLIYDAHWQLIYKNDYFPVFCKKQCTEFGITAADCQSYKPELEKKGLVCTNFKCIYGQTVFHSPIIFDGQVIGFLRGGYINTESHYNGDGNEASYDVPESTVSGILNTLQQIVNSIISTCHLSSMLHERKERQEYLWHAEQENAYLEKDLIKVKNTAINLKINHHFLFNTLNAIANMALTDERENIFNALVDLSKMFRHAMASDLQFVSLMAEIGSLNIYLNLQKLRYADSLDISIDMDPNAESAIVPLNFLQPIAENAFTHGFIVNPRQKILRVSIWVDHAYLLISISNNGAPIDPVRLDEINQSFYIDAGHGLSMVVEKLAAAYGNRFTLRLHSDDDVTTANLSIPFNTMVENHHD